MNAQVGVSPDNIVIKDLYADYRPEVLMRAVPLLLQARAPVTEICGTMLYFTALFVAKVAHESLADGITREDRIFMLHWAAQIATSMHLPVETNRGVFMSHVPIALAACRPEIRKLNRVGTKFAEFKIGTMRTLTNSDQLSVSATLDNKQDKLHCVVLTSGVSSAYNTVYKSFLCTSIRSS